MGEGIRRSQGSSSPRIQTPPPETKTQTSEVKTPPKPNLSRPLPPIPTETKTSFTPVSKPQGETGGTLLDKTSQETKSEKAPRQQGGWQRGEKRTQGPGRQPMLPRKLQASLGKVDTDIGTLRNEVQEMRARTPSEDQLQQDFRTMRDLEKSNEAEQAEISRLRQNLPKIGGGDKKKALQQRETQLGKMTETAQQMRTQRTQGMKQVETLKKKEGELSSLELDRGFLGDMSGKLQRGEPGTSHDLHKLQDLVDKTGPGRDGIQSGAKTLLSKLGQLPALQGLNTLPLGVFKGAGQGTKLGTDSVQQVARELVAGNPELSWAVTTRPESDIKRQIESNLPKLGDPPLSTEQKNRLVDTIYQGLLQGGNTSSQDLSTIKLSGVEYRKVRDLGVGGGGTVALYEDNNRNQVAVKILHPAVDSEMRGKVLQELEGHRKAVGGGAHPNVTDMKGVIRVNDQQLLLAMESVPGGDLQSLTGKIHGGNLSEQQKLQTTQFMMRGAVEGLKNIHDKGMVHLDIKPDNFLLDPQTMKAKLSDFGLTQTSPSVKMNHSEGTDRYMSPQQLSPSYKQIGEVGQKDDVWSLGVMLHEMVTGRNPFGQGLGAGTAVLEFGQNRNNRVFQDEGGRPERQLINQMLHPDPAQRPTLQQVLQHPFFTQNLGTDDQAKQLLRGLG